MISNDKHQVGANNKSLYKNSKFHSKIKTVATPTNPGLVTNDTSGSFTLTQEKIKNRSTSDLLSQFNNLIKLDMFIVDIEGNKPRAKTPSTRSERGFPPSVKLHSLLA